MWTQPLPLRHPIPAKKRKEKRVKIQYVCVMCNIDAFYSLDNNLIINLISRLLKFTSPFICITSFGGSFLLYHESLGTGNPAACIARPHLSNLSKQETSSCMSVTSVNLAT